MPEPSGPLDPCVHCGFCLPACPTYLATGDESDGPRGRIVLMRALERQDEALTDSALALHLDNCLGCRGCEPACPSGVEYGRALATARQVLVERRGIALPMRVLLGIFASPLLWRTGLTLARWLRGSGVPSNLKSRGRIGFAMGMLSATRHPDIHPRRGAATGHSHDLTPAVGNGTVALFRGCVMDTLFEHVHAATKRTLIANGFDVVEVPGQGCCGALHEHAGARTDARALAARNVAAFGDRPDLIVVNSAGCGAILKDYGELLDTPAARRLAGRVRDISEVLSLRGPRTGAPVECDVAYDAACHLQHAQGLTSEPLTVLQAVPELRLHLVPRSDQCCGSAGLYSLLRPTLAHAVLDRKIREIASVRPRPRFVATGNPGCLMQIGAGLRASGLDIDVIHPVELLDHSYQLAGYYDHTASVPSTQR